MNLNTLSWIILVIILLSACLMAAGAEKNAKKKAIYNPQLDVKAAITQSIKAAAQENKHILLMFGGNWCPWCHKLHNLLESNPELKNFIGKHYIVVMVDVGEKANEPLNRDLVDLYRVKGFGYPSLAILDKRGRLLTSQSTGVLEKGKGHNPKRVLGLLTANAPQ